MMECLLILFFLNLALSNGFLVGSFLSRDISLSCSSTSPPSSSATSRNKVVGKIVGKYDTTPCALYRLVTPKKTITIREEGAQRAKQSLSYDYTKREDGLLHPSPESDFIGPNGLSFFPIGLTLNHVITSFRNKFVLEVPENVQLPSELTFVHEHGEHWSLQTTLPVTIRAFEKTVERFIKDFPVYSVADFMKEKY